MRAAAFAAILFFSLPAAAGAKVTYDVPIEWARIETHGDYEEAYQTSLDPAERLFVLIRGVDSGGETAAEWAARQSDAMKRQGLKTGPALEQYFGDEGWSYVDWKDGAGEGGRRYFRDGKNELVEVSIVAREDIFKTADASQFDAFMASFDA